MRKNVSGQTVGIQAITAADGTAFSGTVTVYVTGDGGTQAIGSVGSGVCTHKGNGCHTYAPSQAETNYEHIAFTFIGTGMIPATVQAFTNFPQTGDNFARLGAPAGASVSADVAAVSAQIGNLAVGSAGISITPASFTKSSTEPETNTFASTAALDGVYHIVEDVASVTEFYYQFDVTPNGIPVQCEWTGYAQGNGNSYTVKFYSWLTTSWETVGAISGSNAVTVQSRSFSATTAHVGTGANDGLVRLQFTSANGSAIATDRLLCTYTVVSTSLGYEGGATWVDTASGTSTGTTPGVDGLVTNRSTTFNNAQTIADALGYTSIIVTNGNSVTLSQTINNFTVGTMGGQWTLALGGQNVANCDFSNAIVSGVFTGADVYFDNCEMGTTTVAPPSYFRDCNFTGTVTCGSAGDFEFFNCHSGVVGAAAPIFDLGAALGPSTLEFRRWSGAASFTNIEAGDSIIIDVVSGGVVTVNGTGGEIKINGVVRVVDASSGAVTIDAASAISITSINATVDTALTDYDAPTNTEMVAAFTEIKGATFSGVTDSLEAIRDRGDAAWTGGGSAPTAADIRIEIDSNSTQLAAILADTGTTLPASITALNNLSEANVRTALGLTAANLDTQLAAIDTVVDAILADTGTDGVAISATTANQIADALLKRDFSAVTGEAARSMLNALRFLRNKYSIAGTTLTVTKENDTTTAWTAELTTDAAASPITGSDPA